MKHLTAKELLDYLLKLESEEDIDLNNMLIINESEDSDYDDKSTVVSLDHNKQYIYLRHY